jgi:hypothetical protein
MAAAPCTFQVYGLIVLALLGIWPYMRVMHMFSAPVGYLTRPYLVYRSPDPQKAAPGLGPRTNPRPRVAAGFNAIRRLTHNAE